MGSNSNNITNGTSFQPSEPAPCANGCSFFGSPATNGFCSKCFRDVRLNEEQSASAKAAVDKLMNFNSQPPPSSSTVSEPVRQADVSEPVQPPPAPSEQVQPWRTVSELVQPHTIFEPLQGSQAVAEPVQPQPAASEPAQLSVVSEPVEPPTLIEPVQGSQTLTGPVQPLTEPVQPLTRAVGVNRKVLNRCLLCNKKVGVMGFKCKCGETFCGSHRHPENHDCGFDFKRTGRDLIAKANPVVRADKMNRI